jgi:hypothetical protein
MKEVGPLGHVKKVAKRIKKKYPYIPLMQVQHDLAKYLGFKKWGELILADRQTLQIRIDQNPTEKL